MDAEKCSVFSVQCSARGKAGTFRQAPAFTLIELMVVITIIAILAGLTLASMGYVNRKGAEARARSEVATLSAAIDAFNLEFGKYPSSQATLYAELTGGSNAAINTNKKVFFEPTPGMVTSNAFVDPWGAPYQYSANPTNNIGFFDLWTTAGNASNQPTKFIRN